MARIGDYRLKVYNLFYEKPICKYAVTVEQKKQSNVLILGTGWIGNEVFKASFWAGQDIDTELNITVAAQNASAYKAEVLSIGKDAHLPSLKKYTEEKHYANLKFIDIDVEKGIDEAGLNPLRFETNRYNYIVVSLGNAENNWLAATELITRIGEKSKKPNSVSNPVIVNVFDEFSDGLDADVREMLKEHGRENGIEVYFFGKATDGEGELERIARNIHFSYSMKYDQRVNKMDIDQQFDKSRDEEFVKSPMDYAVGDISVVENFIGGNYVCDSSYASAVHIPMKLNFCREFSNSEDPLDVMKDAIQKKNELYWKLVVLEHRRWNAYTVMRGFRAPTSEEEETLFYQNGNTHQDKKRLLHMCLCDCGEKAILANDFERQYNLWIKNKCPKNDPSELDRASLRAHQITKKISERLDTGTILHFICGNNVEYSNLRRSILKLFNDEDNSLILYQKSLMTALSYAKTISEEEIKKLRKVDQMLFPVKSRNARMDFFSLDEQLVQMLPFALWYGKKYGTIITLSDGMSSSTYDVIVPTLFCAQNAVFVGNAVSGRKYQQAINHYFKSRGDNTVPQFVDLPVMNTETIFDCLKAQVEKYGHHDIIINCVPSHGYDAAIAVGRLMEKYPNNINVVQYQQNKGIVSLSHDKNIGVGLDNKNFSLSEYVQLMGGRIANEYASIYDSKEYESLMVLFKKYCKPTRYAVDEKRKDSFNTWAAVTKFFAQSAKDINFGDGIKTELEDKELHYTGVFSEVVFRNSLIGNVLEQLQMYHIIRNYKKSMEAELVTVDFTYVNRELGDLLQKFENGKIVVADRYKALKFIPMNGGLKIVNRRVYQAPILSTKETEEHRKVKLAFLKDLLQRNYIEDLQINEQNDTVSFAFRDLATMHVMKMQGLIFELIVYYLMRESGKYDEVETGVKIAWDVEDVPLEQKLLKMLERNGADDLGYGAYVKARGKVVKQTIVGERESVKNEIDIIALSGMDATMVSCKTSDNDNMQWVYEIRAVSNHFQAKGVLAIASDYRNKKGTPFVERARQLNVALWGTGTLWNSIFD